MSATEIASKVRAGELNPTAVIGGAIALIEGADTRYNSVTRVLGPRAIGEAEALGRRLRAGEDVGPLAGVPFGVKDLFDMAGEVTTAGSIVLNENPPADADASVVRRLCAAGAIPVATLNMDEFAYGFATENAHYGVTRNPHDVDRLVGGSSGGSAAAVAAGLLPVTLGSDTNGSIRVPASLCGVWGLRPTQGLLPLEGVFPLSASLDVVGPFTASLDDLQLVFEVLADRAVGTPPDVEGLRIAQLGGWFARNMAPEMEQGVTRVLAHLRAADVVELPNVERARAAAFIITAAEGGNLHLPRLRARAAAYDPATRDRLMAGALMPATRILQAQRFRTWFRAQAHALFERYDVLVAPAVPGVAPRRDQPVIVVDGAEVPARANLGLYTQPLSFVGMPILTAPLTVEGLPLGVQLIAAPGREDRLFAVARSLESAGIAGCTLVPPQGRPGL
ncbi:AtzE family amidohydrolase [Ameyamaea chiangmaiensis]|uniref:AtzE family amidohydrolase n=2 Tax=Ameyamaea chiangmaiensis TaxID=442969 RepID=A0A850P7H3_9PROT|nr:AtzE family amidohydrolase [Ameyamaea chiangmaiensis]NVN40547.1 AtzE family amidohydrolase [Ameyamaea chiangmaiensis]